MKTNSFIHNYLGEQLPYKSSILEIGGGEGTAILKVNHRDVTVIEHDPEYLDQVEGVKYIHAPLTAYYNEYFREATLWYDPSKLQGLPIYDAIIIDGPKGTQGRGGFFSNLGLFRTELFIFDDVHRIWEFRLAGQVAKHNRTEMILHPAGKRQWFGVVKGHRDAPLS